MAAAGAMEEAMVTSQLPAVAAPARWQGVERRHLAAFAAVAQTSSFRGAARVLGYSQTAISQLVAQLERTLATPLLWRRSRSGHVTPTAAGELLLEHVTGILDEFAAAQADLEFAVRGAVRVGVVASLAPRLLAPILAGCAQGLEVREVGDDRELAAAVAAGTVELALGEMPPPGPFRVRRLSREDYVLAIPGEWLAARERAGGAAALLSNAPLVDGGDPRVRRDLAARGIEPSYVASAGSDAAALALVRAGTAAAVLPAGAVARWDQPVRALSLKDLVMPRTICAYSHRGRRVARDLAPLLALVRRACAVETTPATTVARAA